MTSGRKSVEAVAAKQASHPAPQPVEAFALPPSADVTVEKLARAWIKSIEEARAGNHKRASDWNGAIAAARALRGVAAMPTKDFGPRAPQDVRRRLVDTPFLRKRRLSGGRGAFDAIPRSRRYVNDTVGRIRQLFNWAVGLELRVSVCLEPSPRSLHLGSSEESARRCLGTRAICPSTA
jgi:hypothetical protein